MRMRKLASGCAIVAAAVAVGGAQRPDAMAPVSPGLWEITGLPGGKPLRQCFSATSALAQLEHRARSCNQRVLRDGASSVSIDYSCGAGEFGRSDVNVLTPRSLRIQTQGISGNMPFSYLLQARRVGDCPPR